MRKYFECSKSKKKCENDIFILKKDQDDTNEEVYKELLALYLIEDETLVFDF